MVRFMMVLPLSVQVHIRSHSGAGGGCGPPPEFPAPCRKMVLFRPANGAVVAALRAAGIIEYTRSRPNDQRKI